MAAQCGGRPCDQEEVTERVEVCNEDPCPVADICVWSSWDSWGDWSLSFNIIEARSVSIFSRILLLRPKQIKSFHHKIRTRTRTREQEGAPSCNLTKTDTEVRDVVVPVTDTEETVTVTDDPEPVVAEPAALSSGLLIGILIILGKETMI